MAFDTSYIDNLAPIQKIHLERLANAEKERREKEAPIRAQTKDRTGTIVWVSEIIQLIEVYHKFNNETRMYWQAVVDGRLTNHCHYTPEAAFLFGLGYKFDEQGNTRFHHFAARMLPGFAEYENGGNI